MWLRETAPTKKICGMFNGECYSDTQFIDWVVREVFMFGSRKEGREQIVKLLE